MPAPPRRGTAWSRCRNDGSRSSVYVKTSSPHIGLRSDQRMQEARSEATPRSGRIQRKSGPSDAGVGNWGAWCGVALGLVTAAIMQ